MMTDPDDRTSSRITAGPAPIASRLQGALRLLILSCAALACGPALAQQAPAIQESIDTIIGTEVQEEEVEAAADPARVIAAIEKTAQSIALVRKASNVARVEIVFLADSTQTEGGPPPEIAAKIKEHEAGIAELRKEVEGNAMLFHAIDSRQILMRDVLAVEFDDANGVVVFAAAKPAG